MMGFKCGNILPPFRDSFFPKAQKIFYTAPPRKQAAESDPRDDWGCETSLSRYETANELRDHSVDTVSEDLRYVNIEEATGAKTDKNESTSDSDWVPGCSGRKKHGEPFEKDPKTARAGRGKQPYVSVKTNMSFNRKEDTVKQHVQGFNKTRFRIKKSLHAFIACAIDTTDQLQQPLSQSES